MTEVQVIALMTNMESDWIERTISTADDKLGQAICAFSNDFPNHQHSGYLLLGVDDNGKLAGIKWTDKELKNIGGIKTNAGILVFGTNPEYYLPGAYIQYVKFLGNAPNFDLSLTTKFKVTIPINRQWQ